MIYLYPTAGLANRIRVIISALALAEKRNDRVVIYWKKDETLNCDFHELFEDNELLNVKQYNWITRLLETGKTNKQIKKFFAKLVYRIMGIGFNMNDTHFPNYVWSNPDYRLNIQDLPKNTNIYISACNEFLFDNKFFEWLKPAKEIQFKIDQITNTFGRNIIGIHIRRSDNLRSIEESPLEVFKVAIYEEIAKNNSVSFFLATDSIEVEEELLKQFNGRITTYKKEYNRNTSQGIKDAMIDLYCLSATNKVYGSYWSSFSDIAARIGKIPLIIVKRQEP